MSVRLLRESSDTPNITNRDDTRMIRYAYGGMDGVIKNFGDELSYSTSGPKFILNSGMIVLQGWEVEVASWELDLSTVTGTQYHLVYLEVNVASETAVIKSAYLTGSVPSIDTGNDLTQYPQGTARLPLYSFVISGGLINDIVKKFSLISYYGSKIADIEERLQNLGFKEGTVTLVDGSTVEHDNTYQRDINYLKRQGNYVIGALSCSNPNGFPLLGSGSQRLVGTVPSEFKGSLIRQLPQYGLVERSHIYTGEKEKVAAIVYVNREGQVEVPMEGREQQLYKISVTFGYEAKAL